VDLQVAKAAAEGKMLLGVDVLAAEKDHAVLDQGLPDFTDDPVIDRLR
jgi:hypothetical protein